MHLLLIEDDLDLGRALQSALKVEGLSSEWRRRAADAPDLLDTEAFDCVLLDLGLPDGSGFDLLARWREHGCTAPIIVITAHGAVEDRLRGLNGGADDFVLKPFVTSELIARIHAVLRRAARQASESWTVGDLVIEPRRHSVRRGGHPVALSPREFQILLELAREPGVVMAKNLLAQRMTPLGEALDSSALEVHVSNLRRKIGADCIRTVRGVGYLLVTS
ncbi:response regulator transcription factor [Variovorax sp. 770b2]|uniref:response regulator n=1 Tax=Variovorax sp. 770b2 TaxID=1566271 RepID=UPI0008F35EE4|nr:response regulator transcription factor [Variovorax sp. 770b2]SFQ05227.1 two-component system, OmpR family, response regulator BasR [Variovorax sp. 770b2]